MAAWRASVSACGVVLATAAAPAIASPIAELEALLRAQAAVPPAERAVGRLPGIEPAAVSDPAALPWRYAVLDRNVRTASIDPQTPTAPAAKPGGDSDFNGAVGCVVTGTLGTTVAALGGGLNTINLIGGGIVGAINPVTFYVSLVGVVFISFCQLGQALTPLYLHLTAPAAPEPVIGVPEVIAPPPLDNLPEFRRSPQPVEPRPGVPMVRASDRPALLPQAIPASPPALRDCVRDRRSISLALTAITHGAAIPPRCSGSLI